MTTILKNWNLIKKVKSFRVNFEGGTVWAKVTKNIAVPAKMRLNIKRQFGTTKMPQPFVGIF